MARVARTTLIIAKVIMVAFPFDCVGVIPNVCIDTITLSAIFARIIEKDRKYFEAHSCE